MLHSAYTLEFGTGNPTRPFPEHWGCSIHRRVRDRSRVLLHPQHKGSRQSGRSQYKRTRTVNLAQGLPRHPNIGVGSRQRLFHGKVKESA